mmetsp:Transcript_5193/g.11471  ORF Transcript_5193/g.11471 Transcript_5193/m.11471 type:complete len:145 (-) Transcript_5193:2049-2483(-)
MNSRVFVQINCFLWQSFVCFLQLLFCFVLFWTVRQESFGRPCERNHLASGSPSLSIMLKYILSGRKKMWERYAPTRSRIVPVLKKLRFLFPSIYSRGLKIYFVLVHACSVDFVSGQLSFYLRVALLEIPIKWISRDRDNSPRLA